MNLDYASTQWILLFLSLSKTPSLLHAFQKLLPQAASQKLRDVS